MRVKLTADLTRYDRRLPGGQEGSAGEFGGTDCLVWVTFDCGARLQVLWSSLEIIDVEILARMAAHRAQEEAAAAKATDVVVFLGPLEGFRSLCYKTAGPPPANVSVVDKAAADRLMAVMQANNVPFRVERALRRSR